MNPHPDAEVIIIGAGIAGLSAYHELAQQRVKVLILEKSRGLGGRCATRRGEHFVADHGAQFFRIKNPHWAILVESHRSHLRSIQLHSSSTHPRYVHEAGMSSLTRFFDAKASVKTLEKVTRVEHSLETGVYVLNTESGNRFTAKNIVLTAPIPQSLDLLNASDFKIQNPEVESKLRAIQYEPCLALILELNTPIRFGPFGILKNPNSDFAGIYNQDQKGLNTPSPSLVIHASPALSQELWNEEPDHIKSILISKVEACLLKIGVSLEIGQIHLHRWKYSEPKMCYEKSYVFLKSPGQELALAGDGFGSSSIEGAFESGLSAARALLQQGI